MTDADGFYAQLQTLQDGLSSSLAAAPARPGRETGVPLASATAAVPKVRPSSNGPARQSAALPRIDDPVAIAPSRAVAAVVETIEADRPADLGEALALVGEVVTAAGNQPLALDDPGAVWRVTSGQVDVFYSRPEPGQDRGRRCHLCRVEEGGSIFGLEGVKSGEQGELLAVGVGPARLLKVPKAALLRLSLESDWRADVAALVDDWVDRISRATSGGDPPKAMTVLERDEPHQVAEGGHLTARREVLWVQPGSAGIRFLDGVPVATCPYESRFPLSTHAWISYNQAETVRPWNTETLIERGDPWEGLKRFHRVVLEAIAAALARETAQADARRASSRLRDVARVSTAMTRLCSPGRAEPSRPSPRRSRWPRATCSPRPVGQWVRRRGSRSRPRDSTVWTTRSGSSHGPRVSAPGGSSCPGGGGRRTPPRCSAAAPTMAGRSP
jgi:hypothetical protein